MFDKTFFEVLRRQKQRTQSVDKAIQEMLNKERREEIKRQEEREKQEEMKRQTTSEQS